MHDQHPNYNSCAISTSTVKINVEKFGQICETWPKLSKVVEIEKFVRFGMVWYGLNGSESTTINVGRGYVITGVGIELLGQLKRK